MKLPYTLELLTDAAITRRSASVGGHESLPYVPGQCILGAAAAPLYAALARDGLAWEAFHSGETRFGDARPRVGTSPGWPVPLSFHLPKGERDIVNGRVTDRAVNGLHHGLGGAVQWKQLRGVFVSLDGAALAHAPRRSMRTAVGAKGQARDGFLFELEAIPAGVVLQGVIEGRDALVARVRDALHGKTIRVGRSRSAEFGKARFEALDGEPQGPATADHHDREHVSFWCVSDLCLRHRETGQPTFLPSAEDFGLPEGWSFDPARSFVKTRRYTPFNAHRGAFDLERQVLSTGSVLSFKGPDGLDASAWGRVASAIAAGVGEHRAEGLGAVMFEHRLLASERPSWEPSVAAPPAPIEPIAMPTDALGRWLAAEIRHHDVATQAWTVVRAQLDAMEKARRAWAAIPNAQWGEIRALARRLRGRSRELAEELATHVGHVPEEASKRGEQPAAARLPRGARARIWKDWRDGVQPAAAIVAWYQAVDEATPDAAPLALELLASHAVRAKKAQARREVTEAGG